MHPLLRDIKALRTFALHYLAARTDALTARLRRTGVLVAVGLLGAVAGMTMVIVAVVLTLRGLAGLIGAALGAGWAGDLIIGFGLLLLLGAVAATGVYMLFQSFARKTREKYERRRNQERAAVGQDAAERAATAKSRA